ncbi:unnamed protein product [Phaedon cochleariae]|uniref:Attacin C-terminal domain-containing protein n=1 Tax=Phaedon cochleariae TaxID=80249 RepID=A0A9P0DVG5_PHACE|nr:unnamed protein product [Phaedon cochleariae]
MKVFGFVALCLAVAVAVPVEVFEDDNGQEFLLVPVSRQKRQTKWGISNSGAGISHTGTIYSNGRHQLDGTASAAKNFPSHGLRPDQVGGRLDYTHNPSGSGAFVGADRTRNWGTDVSAGGKYNIYTSPKKDFGVDATGVQLPLDHRNVSGTEQWRRLRSPFSGWCRCCICPLQQRQFPNCASCRLGRTLRNQKGCACSPSGHQSGRA